MGAGPAAVRGVAALLLSRQRFLPEVVPGEGWSVFLGVGSAGNTVGCSCPGVEVVFLRKHAH